MLHAVGAEKNDGHHAGLSNFLLKVYSVESGEKS